MEPVLPIEELANQRLNVMVHAYTFLVGNLMEAGVDREIVKAASDKVWATLGEQAAVQLKPMYGEITDITALQQVGAIAESVHGIEVNEKITASQIETEFTKCPWQDAYIALDMPQDWRLCPSGHVAFTRAMYAGLSPKAGYELMQSMPGGDQICKGIASL
jgi:hypothetical protein